MGDVGSYGLNERLSIIIPYKDDPESLYSLLNAIPKGAWDVIVVNDHSVYDRVSVVKDFENVRFFNNPDRRQGSGSARQTGIGEAGGDWILVADADDHFLPGAFDTIEGYLESDADVIYFRSTSHWNGTTGVALRHSANSELVDGWIQCENDWIRYRFNVTWSKLVRRDLFERCGIVCDETKVTNDVVFSLKVGLYARKIIAVNEVIYSVTQGNANSLTSKQSEEFYDIRLDRHLGYNQVLEEHGLRDRRMAVLRMLKKALQFGPRKFLQVLWLCVRTRQPFVDHWHYVWMLWRRRLLKHRYRG